MFPPMWPRPTKPTAVVVISVAVLNLPPPRARRRVWRVPRRSGGSSPAAVPSFSPSRARFVTHAERLQRCASPASKPPAISHARNVSGTAVQLVFRIQAAVTVGEAPDQGPLHEPTWEVPQSDKIVA